MPIAIYNIIWMVAAVGAVIVGIIFTILEQMQSRKVQKRRFARDHFKGQRP